MTEQEREQMVKAINSTLQQAKDAIELGDKATSIRAVETMAEGWNIYLNEFYFLQNNNAAKINL